MDNSADENYKQYAGLRWSVDKNFGIILGTNFIDDFEQNNEVCVEGFDYVKAQDGFKELQGKDLKIYYGFDARQEFDDERVFQYNGVVTYQEVGGLKLRFATHNSKVYRALLDRAYSKKKNNESQEWIVNMLSYKYLLDKPNEQRERYAQWVTQYTELTVECKKAAMPFANELRVHAKAIIDIDDFPNYYDDTKSS